MIFRRGLRGGSWGGDEEAYRLGEENGMVVKCKMRWLVCILGFLYYYRTEWWS